MSEIIVRRLGLTEYVPTWHQMRDFTDRRGPDTPDEIWLLQHYPVYTQGLSCSAMPATPVDIAVVHTDRGGQITYHGPGQIIVYPLIDLRRRKLGIKRMVNLLEQSVIDILRAYGITGERVPRAPGVYVQEKKVAALGLRVRRGASYHGLSFNIDMDLAPFASIDPCGYRDLVVTQLKDFDVDRTVAEVEAELALRVVYHLRNS